MIKNVFIMLTLFLSAVVHGEDRKTIYVGAYEFPPYVEVKDSKVTGYTADLIAAFNSSQNKFNFKIYLTSPQRRYRDFKNKKYDMIFFEDPSWGWMEKSLEDELLQSEVFLHGGEVYITKSEPNKTQKYFENLRDKTKMGFLGYHYNFANFKANPSYLKKEHKMALATSHSTIIKAVKEARFDIGIVTIAFLDKYFQSNPEEKKSLLISEKKDQVYNHKILLRKGIKNLSIKEVENLLKMLKKKKEFSYVFKGNE